MAKEQKFAWAPRAYLVEPKNFGKFDEVRWLSSWPKTRWTPGGDFTKQDKDRLLAAQWQHSLCYLVRSAAQYRGQTIDQLAEETRVGQTCGGGSCEATGPCAWRTSRR